MREHWEGIVVGRKTLDGVAGTSRPSRRAPAAIKNILFLVHTRIYALFQAVPLPPELQARPRRPPEGKAEARHARAPRPRARGTSAYPIGHYTR